MCLNYFYKKKPYELQISSVVVEILLKTFLSLFSCCHQVIHCLNHIIYRQEIVFAFKPPSINNQIFIIMKINILEAHCLISTLVVNAGVMNYDIFSILHFAPQTKILVKVKKIKYMTVQFVLFSKVLSFFNNLKKYMQFRFRVI